jgi:hypothetical protein
VEHYDRNRDAHAGFAASPWLASFGFDLLSGFRNRCLDNLDGNVLAVESAENETSRCVPVNRLTDDCMLTKPLSMQVKSRATGFAVSHESRPVMLMTVLDVHDA